MKLEEYQKELNNLLNIIYNSNKLINELKDKAKLDGFYCTHGTFDKYEKVMGYVSKYAYYTRYVAEAGSMYNGGQQAYRIEDIDIKQLGKELLALKEKALKSEEEATPGVNYKPNPMTNWEFEKVFKQYEEFYPEGLYYPKIEDYKNKTYGFYTSPSSMTETATYNFEKYIEACTDFIECFTYENDKISYRFAGTSRPQNFVDDSGFDLGFYDSEYLDNFNNNSYEDEFDVYSHRGKVEW